MAFSGFVLDTLFHSWSVSMMKITDLSILCKEKSALYQILIFSTVCYSCVKLPPHPPSYYMQMVPTVYPPGTQSCFQICPVFWSQGSTPDK